MTADLYQKIIKASKKCYNTFQEVKKLSIQSFVSNKHVFQNTFLGKELRKSAMSQDTPEE